MGKNQRRIILAVMASAILALAAYGGWRLFETKRQERAAEQDAEQATRAWEREFMRPYQEDRVGGQTPEETFRLFLEALKKEDIDLAAKYFLVDKQEEWREFLMDVRNAGEWENMVGDLSDAKGGQGTSENNYQYDVLDKDGVVGAIIDIIRQPNGIWKIRSL